MFLHQKCTPRWKYLAIYSCLSTWLCYSYVANWFVFTNLWGSSWPWSYGSWIYNYLCNSAYHHWCCEFESWSGRGVQHYMIQCVSDLWDRSVVFFTNKINRHNITEILLLKVALSTIKQTNNCPIGSFFIWAKQFCSFCSLSVR